MLRIEFKYQYGKDSKQLRWSEYAQKFIFTAILGGIFNVCGDKWASSLNFESPASSVQGNILKKLVSLCNINIQEVRNSIIGSIGINYILGNRQLVINQVYDYLEGQF